MKNWIYSQDEVLMSPPKITNGVNGFSMKKDSRIMPLQETRLAKLRDSRNTK